MKAAILGTVPVLPSQDITRDVAWYNEYAGFEVVHNDAYYAVLKRQAIFLHLQWHADTPDDPLLGGSVVKLFVDDVQPFYDEFLERETPTLSPLRKNTAWNTHEFGFYDLNKNAIFIVEAI